MNIHENIDEHSSWTFILFFKKLRLPNTQPHQERPNPTTSQNWISPKYSKINTINEQNCSGFKINTNSLNQIESVRFSSTTTNSKPDLKWIGKECPNPNQNRTHQASKKKSSDQNKQGPVANRTSPTEPALHQSDRAGLVSSINSKNTTEPALYHQLNRIRIKR